MKLSKLKFPYRASAVIADISPDTWRIEWIRQAGDAVVVFLTGSAVGSRKYDLDDPIVRRIKHNASLYNTQYSAGNIDFIRKQDVDKALEEISHGGKNVLEVVVCKDLNNTEIDNMIATVLQEKFSFKALKSDFGLLNLLVSEYVKKLLMPLLLFYLFVLFANMLINSRLTEKLAEVRSTYNAEMEVADKISRTTQAQEKLLSLYHAVPNHYVAGISDAIAASLSPNVRLTSVSINGTKESFALISGEATTEADVMSAVSELRRNLPCRSLNIKRLEKDYKQNLFMFEIMALL